MKPVYFLSFLLPVAFFIGCASKNITDHPSESSFEFEFKVENYNQYYEVDPDGKFFKSSQEISITNVSDKHLSQINFSLHPKLIIDHLAIRNLDGKETSIKQWKKIGVRRTTRTWADTSLNEFPVYQIQTLKNIAPHQQLFFEIDYHLDPGFIRDYPKEMYELTVSSKASYAVGPFTGHSPFFGRNIAAPFTITIKHLKDTQTCAPGNLITSKQENQFVIDIYECKYPNIPTFSCGKYQRISRKSDTFRLEYYLYPDQQVTEGMIETTFRIIDLYTKTFGDNGTREYRFGTVGKAKSWNLGGENKGNAIFLTDFATRVYTSWLLNWSASLFTGGLSGKDVNFRLFSHELYHNWNLFYVHWSGKLYEWFEEGGANFIAAWAAERVIGIEAGAQVRKSFIKSFIENKGYEASQPLESVRKTGNAERALMYNYGAIVWEQLRRKLGDEAFFTRLKEFYREKGLKQATYEEFLTIFQASADIDVEKFLSQWTTENAKIKLTIGDVSIQKKKTGYRTSVEIEVDSEKDYDIVTAIGYKTPQQENLIIVPINITQNGKYVYIMDTLQKPTYIQVDPNYSVPRINLGNCEWKG
jgi:hypothetical protein